MADSDKIRRQCFCCGKVLVSSGICGGDVLMPFTDPPNHAVCWHTRGNWGSAIIDSDPYGPSFEISICDDCLIEREERVLWHDGGGAFQQKMVKIGIGLGIKCGPIVTHFMESMDHLRKSLNRKDSP